MRKDTTGRPEIWASLEQSETSKNWLTFRYQDDPEGWKEYEADAEEMRETITQAAGLLAVHLKQAEEKNTPDGRRGLFDALLKRIEEIKDPETRRRTAEAITGRQLSPLHPAESIRDGLARLDTDILLYRLKAATAKTEKQLEEARGLAVFYDSFYASIIATDLKGYGITLSEIGLKPNPRPDGLPVFLPAKHRAKEKLPEDLPAVTLNRSPDELKLPKHKMATIHFVGLISERTRQAEGAEDFLELIRPEGTEEEELLNGYIDTGSSRFTTFDYAVLAAVCSFWLNEYPDPKFWQGDRFKARTFFSIRQIEKIITGCPPSSDKEKQGKHGTSGGPTWQRIRKSLSKMQNHRYKRADDPLAGQRFLNINFLSGSYVVRGQVFKGGKEYADALRVFQEKAQTIRSQAEKEILLEMKEAKRQLPTTPEERAAFQREIDEETARRQKERLKKEGLDEPAAYDCIVEIVGPPLPLLLSVRDVDTVPVHTAPLAVFDIRRMTEDGKPGRAIHTTPRSVSAAFFLALNANRTFENPEQQAPTFESLFRATFAEELEEETPEEFEKRAKSRRHDLRELLEVILEYWKYCDYIGPKSCLAGNRGQEKIFFDPNRSPDMKSKKERRADKKREKTAKARKSRPKK